LQRCFGNIFCLYQNAAYGAIEVIPGTNAPAYVAVGGGANWPPDVFITIFYCTGQASSVNRLPFIGYIGNYFVVISANELLALKVIFNKPLVGNSQVAQFGIEHGHRHRGMFNKCVQHRSFPVLFRYIAPNGNEVTRRFFNGDGPLNCSVLIMPV
jgi:hypothetical protein